MLCDPWAILVLRDIMIGNRRHFRELVAGSEEGIATNILASRLKQLVAAEHIGISPVGRWYAAAVEYLAEQGALEPTPRTGNVVGEPRYVLGERAPELMEGG